MAEKPETDIHLIIEWADKARNNCGTQGRKEAAMLWGDCLAHLKYLNSVAEWQPIETVPKDGTIVDLLHKSGGRMTDLWWAGYHCFSNELGLNDFTHWRLVDIYN